MSCFTTWYQSKDFLHEHKSAAFSWEISVFSLSISFFRFIFLQCYFSSFSRENFSSTLSFLIMFLICSIAFRFRFVFQSHMILLHHFVCSINISHFVISLRFRLRIFPQFLGFQFHCLIRARLFDFWLGFYLSILPLFNSLQVPVLISLVSWLKCQLWFSFIFKLSVLVAIFLLSQFPPNLRVCGSNLHCFSVYYWTITFRVFSSIQQFSFIFRSDCLQFDFNLNLFLSICCLSSISCAIRFSFRLSHFPSISKDTYFNSFISLNVLDSLIVSWSCFCSTLIEIGFFKLMDRFGSAWKFYVAKEFIYEFGLEIHMHQSASESLRLLLIEDFLVMSMRAIGAAIICNDWWFDNYILLYFSLFWMRQIYSVQYLM